MNRFWITLEQGVGFVLDRLEHMVGGELFVPKLPSMNIMDLAKVIAHECKTEIIGIRPGEELHELMITKDDARRTLEFKSYYMIQPEFHYWKRRHKTKNGKPVTEDFEYNSGTNPWQLDPDNVLKIIDNL
jgi:UDP-N-acetylglucosamine 4,6-dehydratase